MKKYSEKSSAQLKEIVDLVRNGLSAGLRNTLRSLLVVEIHAQGIVHTKVGRLFCCEYKTNKLFYRNN